jgi:hypothetical protein
MKMLDAVYSESTIPDKFAIDLSPFSFAGQI